MGCLIIGLVAGMIVSILFGFLPGAVICLILLVIIGIISNS